MDHNLFLFNIIYMDQKETRQFTFYFYRMYKR